MKKLITWLLLLLALPMQAQEDSLQANRYVMRATLYGVGFTNILDTYLSPAEYTGPEVRILRESMRMTKLMDGRVSVQSLFQGHLSLTENRAGTGSEMAGLVNWNYALHYQFRLSEKLKTLAGPLLDINGGFVYNLRNSNNPAQAKAYANLAASGMVIYRFRIGNYPLVARYQANLPLMGIMFSPEYGQSYYEIFSLKHGGKNVLFTSLHNQPSLRQFLTLDFPIRSVNMRFGYVCDIQQAQVNHLKSHTWSHAFILGFVKNFYLLKGKNKVAMPSGVSPY
ncbi:MAG: DUF3316 domain-containing protein [Bacteroidales bacterium]|nr:DUF3316 domain-containing protein [Bacteroidales bacterium]